MVIPYTFNAKTTICPRIIGTRYSNMKYKEEHTFRSPFKSPSPCQPPKI